MITNSVIRAEDLTCFFVNEKYVNIPNTRQNILSSSETASSKIMSPAVQEWVHIINVDTSDLVEHVKSVSKKDSLIISQRVSKPEVIQLQCCGNKTDGGIVTIRTRNYTPVSYNIVEANRRPTTCPNVTIQLSKFCNCLLSLVKSRFSKIFMKIYPEGITIIGTSQTGSSSRSATFGRIVSLLQPHQSVGMSSSDSMTPLTTPYHQINLSVQSVSSLIKMINFNSDGIVRIYCTTNTMARIETPIGCFGSMRVYVLDSCTNQKGGGGFSSSQHYKKHAFG